MSIKPKTSISFEPAMKRIQQITGWKTDKELSKFLKISSTNISQARKNGYIPVEWLYLVSGAHKCNIHWLIFGEGSPHSSLVKYEDQGDISNESKETYNHIIKEDLGGSGVQQRDIQECYDAVYEIMRSKNELVKAALKSNLVAFRDAIKNSKDIDELRREIQELKLLTYPQLRGTGLKEM